MSSTRHIYTFIILGVLILLLLVLDMCAGSVSISFGDIVKSLIGTIEDANTQKIVCDIRLVKALVAMLAGLALTVSGLEMQTLFRNPLAGPYVLGVSAGASLAVAIFMLGAPLFGTLGETLTSIGMIGSALIGATLILGIVAAVGHRIKDIMVVLILGMMISSGISAIVQVLQFISSDEALKSFVMWNMGALGNVTSNQLPILAGAVILGLILAIAAIKPLNMLLLGEEYAVTMGMRVGRTRLMVFASTALLAGSVTAFCGPIGFIGLALPHVARAIFRTSDHKVLLPGAALTGAAVMLACDIITKQFSLPINAVTALVGLPTVVWIVLKNSRISR